MYGWTAIRDYFNRPGSLDGIRNEYSEVRARLLAPRTTIVRARLRFDIASVVTADSREAP